MADHNAISTETHDWLVAKLLNWFFQGRAPKKDDSVEFGKLYGFYDGEWGSITDLEAVIPITVLKDW